jgi:hypothetical protein
MSENNDVPKAPLVVERINTERLSSAQKKAREYKEWKEKWAKQPKADTKPKKITKRNFNPLQPDLWPLLTHSDLMFPKRTREQALPILEEFLDPGQNRFTKDEDSVWTPTRQHNWIPKYMIHFFSMHQPQRVVMKMVVAGFNTVLIPDTQQWKFPSFENCAMSIWLFPTTLSDWYHKTDENWQPIFCQEYNLAYKQCLQMQKNFIIESCAFGTMNMNFGKFLLSSLHWMNETTIAETIDRVKKDELDKVKQILDNPIADKEMIKDAKDVYLSLLWRV